MFIHPTKYKPSFTSQLLLNFHKYVTWVFCSIFLYIWKVNHDVFCKILSHISQFLSLVYGENLFSYHKEQIINIPLQGFGGNWKIGVNYWNRKGYRLKLIASLRLYFFVCACVCVCKHICVFVDLQVCKVCLHMCVNVCESKTTTTGSVSQPITTLAFETWSPSEWPGNHQEGRSDWPMIPMFPLFLLFQLCAYEAVCHTGFFFLGSRGQIQMPVPVELALFQWSLDPVFVFFLKKEIRFQQKRYEEKIVLTWWSNKETILCLITTISQASETSVRNIWVFP